MIRACLPSAANSPAYVGYVFATYLTPPVRTVIAHRLYLALTTVSLQRGGTVGLRPIVSASTAPSRSEALRTSIDAFQARP